MKIASSASTSRDISLSGDIFVSWKTKKGENFQTIVSGIFRGENYVQGNFPIFGHQAIKLRTQRDKILFSSKKKRGSQSHCVENKYYYSIEILLMK